MRNLKLTTDVCVVGGGLSGVCAAIAAARHGADVVLVHDRPVLGGNASSEIRMWICGAQGTEDHFHPDMLETGIIEEIRLKNMYRNPYGNWSIWDSILYEMIWAESKIKLMANCTCMDGEMEGARLKSIKAWQMTTETRLQVDAELFIDCSGDGILIPLTGAEHRIGREAAGEFGEDIDLQVADKKTMGMSCLLQTREMDRPRRYIAPDWANVYETDADLNNRQHSMKSHNFWWLELGGDRDSIHDAEEIKDELLKTSFGIWDHIKNRDEKHGSENWQLEWAGFLPGKRESRRYIGDYVLTHTDVRNEGRFDDLIAYGGWAMDDHPPAGFRHEGAPTLMHEAPAPYGIPYRSLYSKNIENLMCAGRNISATHMALSSTRVMATCSLIGQAAGTAAAIAVAGGLTPREVGQQKIGELKQALMQDDCYLPWNVREVSELMKAAVLSASEGDAEALRDGVSRPVGGVSHGWTAKAGAQVTAEWELVMTVSQIRLVFDSDLNRGTFGKKIAVNMPCRYTQEMHEQAPPPSLVKAFHVDVLTESGEWESVWVEKNNIQRHVEFSLDRMARAVRLTLDETWGDDAIRVFEWDVC